MKNKQIKKLYDRIMGRSPPRNLWFDDGYVEDYTIIFPLLRKYNLCGTIAVVTDWIGKKGFLNVDQLKLMMCEGWKIASHSVTHRNLKELTLESADLELRSSKKWIEQNLNVTPIGFMPPYGIHEITSSQRQVALKYYPFVCRERIHFHSWHFRPNAYDKRHGVVKYERETLKKILQDIELRSGFFKCNIHELKLPDVGNKLPVGYTLKGVFAKRASNKQKRGWEHLQGYKWCVPDDALIFFIEFDGIVVATEYAIARNNVGTLHSAVVDEKHRQKGFYRLMTVSGIKYLIEQGIEDFEVHTNVRILWHFWHSLGFRKVFIVSSHARSRAFRKKEENK